MAIFVGNDVVEDDHLIERVFDALHAKSFTAIHIMLIDACVIGFGLRSSDPPSAYQFRVCSNKIFAGTEGRLVIPYKPVGHMGDAEPIANFGGDHFVEDLRHGRRTTCL